MQTQDWISLAKQFEDYGKQETRARKNFTALAQICGFLDASRFGQDLVHCVDRPGQLVLRCRNGSHPTKFLRVMSIIDDQIEFCLRDDATNVERYFQPHEPHHHALERFKEVVGSINWAKPVSPPSPSERVLAWSRFLFVGRYGTWQSRKD